jgi:hypothetical protein
MTNRKIQAYRQTPWRIQKQWIGFVALALVLVAAVSWIYLNISAQAVDTGLEIQNLEDTALAMDRQIASDSSQLGFLTSNAQMAKRADDMGFVPIKSEDAVYMTIPGYSPRPTAALAPAASQEMAQPPLIQPAYTESFWDLFLRQVLNQGTQQAQVQP